MKYILASKSPRRSEILRKAGFKFKVIPSNVDESKISSDKLVVFGNLPYNISTKILAKLLPPSNDKNKWEKLFLMFQLEVANRIVAKPNTKQYGRLSLFSQFYSFPSLELQIPKTSFFPIPKVESALVKFQSNYKYYQKHNNALFRDIVKKSFQGRRKMIKNTLKTINKNIIELMAISDIPENSRPENINLQQFCNLTKEIDRLNA